MEIENQVRQEVRRQIKRQASGPCLEEGAIGNSIRAAGLATGVATSVVSLAIGATISALTLNKVPFYFGVAGAATSALRTKLLFKLAEKVDNLEVRYQFKKMTEIVKERDELLVQIDSSDDESETERLERKVERLTAKQMSLAKKIKDTFKKDPNVKEYFTEKQRRKVDEMIDFAQEGALTTFQPQ